MKFLVACGGSGGHVFPGVAAAQVLRKAGHTVALILSGHSVEGERPADWDGEILRLPCPAPKTLRGLLGFIAAFRRDYIAIRKFKPDALLATGSYTSVPPALMARRLGVPLVLHEGNAIPGKAVKFLARFAKTTCLSFEGCAKFFPDKTRTVFTGHPLRDGVVGAKNADEKNDVFTLLVMGGSQGARGLNRIVADAVRILDAKQSATPDGRRLRVVHIAGARNESEVRASYEGLANIRTETIGFTNDIGRIYAETDFCVSRAGASSIYELRANGIPSLLVPLAGLANDHQVFNAREATRLGCAQIALQSELTPESLASRLESAISAPEKPHTPDNKTNPVKHSEPARQIAEKLLNAAYKTKN